MHPEGVQLVPGQSLAIFHSVLIQEHPKIFLEGVHTAVLFLVLCMRSYILLDRLADQVVSAGPQQG